MTSVKSQLVGIDFSGPFFQAANPGETMLQNMRMMFLGVAVEGQRALRTDMLINSNKRQLVSVTKDRVADHVIGRVQSLAGTRWVSAAVVQVSTQGLDAKQAMAVEAAGSVVEGRIHGVRKIKSSIRDYNAVTSANLTKGLD
jgi:hypothetical protein